MREFKLLINGSWYPASQGLMSSTQRPRKCWRRRRELIACSLTRRSPPRRRRSPPGRPNQFRERGALLVKLADALEARQDEFARLLTLEQGKPLSEAHWEIGFTIRHYSPLRDARSAKQSLEGRRHTKNRAAVHRLSVWSRRLCRGISRCSCSSSRWLRRCLPATRWSRSRRQRRR